MAKRRLTAADVNDALGLIECVFKDRFSVLNEPFSTELDRMKAAVAMFRVALKDFTEELDGMAERREIDFELYEVFLLPTDMLTE